MKSILKCYEALYTLGMTHRDLKPQNMLIKNQGNKKIIKISDFGTATEKGNKNEENAYTLLYASPQQIKSHEYTNKCDVYALGCIFF